MNGKDTRALSDTQKSVLRAQTFGFLFQSFRLIPSKTVLENVALALDITGLEGKRQRELALEALEEVGLAGRAAHLPPELSGGESQRVAFARALVRTPKVLLADEPTGNLDTANRDRLLELIAQFHERGGTVVMVTHDDAAAARDPHPSFRRADANCSGSCLNANGAGTLCRWWYLFFTAALCLKLWIQLLLQHDLKYE